jgi:hypothetical protein
MPVAWLSGLIGSGVLFIGLRFFINSAAREDGGLADLAVDARRSIPGRS